MITAIILARMGSSRLPGKALMPILGRPMLELLVERVQRSRNLKRIVLATTDQPQDNHLAACAANLGLGVFRGSADDVLHRLSAATAAFHADPAVVLLGDNPLVEGELVDDVLELFEAADYDFVTNVTSEYPHAPSQLPCFAIGIRVQVMSAETVIRCEQQATADYHREHATTYIVDNPQRFQIGYVAASGKWSGLNRPNGFLAVNTQEDFDNLSNLIKRTAAVDPKCGLRSIVW